MCITSSARWLTLLFATLLILPESSLGVPIVAQTIPAAVGAQDSGQAPIIGEPSLVPGTASGLVNLGDEYLAVIGILTLSVILAMRRRAHLAMGSRRR